MTMATAWPYPATTGSPGAHRGSPPRKPGDVKRSGSISELHRQHSSFGDSAGKNPQPQHPIFNNVSVLDSPTASATTFSSGGSPFGSSGKGSPAAAFTPASEASPAGSNVSGSPQSSSAESPNTASVASPGIDHMALLLGFQEEESSDDEVEWNSTFSPRASLDELEMTNEEDTGDANEDNGNALDQQLISAMKRVSEMTAENAEEPNEDSDIGDSGHNDGLQLDISSATMGDMPVTYNYDNDPEETPTHATNAPLRLDWKPPKFPTGGLDEEDSYGVRKNLHSMEHKCKNATQRAKAMKERAGSALVAKAERAKEKVTDIKLPGVPLKVRRAQQQAQLNDMEIIADDKCEVMSQVSEVSKRFDASGSARASPRRSLFKSRISSKASAVSNRSKQTGKSAASHVGSKLSAVTSLKEKAGSAISQKAHRAKEKTVGAVLATSGPLMMRQHSKGAVRTRQRLALPPHVKNEVESLPSMDDETRSDVPSLFNSLGPSVDNESARLALSPSAFGLSPGAFGIASPVSPTTQKSASMFATPKASRKGGLQVIGEVPPLHEAAQRGTLTAGGEEFRTLVGSPISPVSCIDENGFLLSPSASVASLEALKASSVASTVGSDGEPFDPNSFLFLSPLSHHDNDDPDYGMPALLSRSHGHNAAAAVSANAAPSPAGKGAPGKPKLLPRLLSPRLPPTSKKSLGSPRKKLMKKTKGDNGDVGSRPAPSKQASGTKEVMGRHLKPPSGSHRRLRSSMF
ncbi:hypothetical protein ACHAXT_010579 [Thalassiosira profunda]